MTAELDREIALMGLPVTPSTPMVDLIDQEASRTRELLEAAYLKATDPGATNADIQRHIALTNQWMALLDRRRDELDRTEKRGLDALIHAQWGEETRQLEARLIDAYASRGPQYDVLCKVLAPLVVKLQHSFDGSVPLTTPEQRELAKTASLLVAQLQRHTESTRMEGTIHAESTERVLRVVELRLLSQPRLYRDIVSDVRALIEGREPGANGGGESDDK